MKTKTMRAKKNPYLKPSISVQSTLLCIESIGVWNRKRILIFTNICIALMRQHAAVLGGFDLNYFLLETNPKAANEIIILMNQFNCIFGEWHHFIRIKDGKHRVPPGVPFCIANKLFKFHFSFFCFFFLRNFCKCVTSYIKWKLSSLSH